MDTLDRLIHFSQPLKTSLWFSTCQKYNMANKREVANHIYCKWNPKLMFHLCNSKQAFRLKTVVWLFLKILLQLMHQTLVRRIWASNHIQGNRDKAKVKVAQSYPTLSDPMFYTVHGILQARTLEWVAFPFSRESSQPRDQTQVPYIEVDSLPTVLWGKQKAKQRSEWPRKPWWCGHSPRARHPGVWSQVRLRKHHYEQS